MLGHLTVQNFGPRIFRFEVETRLTPGFANLAIGGQLTATKWCWSTKKIAGASLWFHGKKSQRQKKKKSQKQHVKDKEEKNS